MPDMNQLGEILRQTYEPLLTQVFNHRPLLMGDWRTHCPMIWRDEQQVRIVKHPLTVGKLMRMLSKFDQSALVRTTDGYEGGDSEIYRVTQRTCVTDGMPDVVVIE